MKEHSHAPTLIQAAMQWAERMLSMIGLLEVSYADHAMVTTISPGGSRLCCTPERRTFGCSAPATSARDC